MYDKLQHVSWIEEMHKANSVEKHFEKRSIRSPRMKCDDEIKLALRKIDCENRR
jgi:hypothetical protein